MFLVLFCSFCFLVPNSYYSSYCLFWCCWDLWQLAQIRPRICCALVVKSCLTIETPWTAAHQALPGKNTGVCCHFLLQGIFPTQGSNLCLWLRGFFTAEPLDAMTHHWMDIRFHHFMANRWGNNGNSDRLYFGGRQNQCRCWLQPWN